MNIVGEPAVMIKNVSFWILQQECLLLMVRDLDLPLFPFEIFLGYDWVLGLFALQSDPGIATATSGRSSVVCVAIISFPGLYLRLKVSDGAIEFLELKSDDVGASVVAPSTTTGCGAIKQGR